MKYRLKKYYSRIPDKELLGDLRKTARLLGKKTLTRDEYSSFGTFSNSAVYRRFGSWNRALSLAGLQIQKHFYVSTEMLLQNLKHVWDSLGRQPGIKEMVKPISAHGGETYAKKFGSWRAALEAFVMYSSKKGCRPPVTMPRFTRKRNKGCIVSVTKSLRFDILKRDNYKCRLCGDSPAIHRGVTLHVDHIIPRSKGGETSPSNLQTLCSSCNYGKGAKSITD